MTTKEITLKDGVLVIPNNTQLAPVCIATGAAGVPLVQLRWLHRRGSAGGKTFWFDFFITPEEKKRRDRAKSRFWILLVLAMVLVPLSMAGLVTVLMLADSIYALLGCAALVAVAYCFLLLKLAAASRIRHYVAARGRWWAGDAIELRELSPITIEQLLAASRATGPADSGRPPPLR